MPFSHIQRSSELKTWGENRPNLQSWGKGWGLAANVQLRMKLSCNLYLKKLAPCQHTHDQSCSQCDDLQRVLHDIENYLLSEACLTQDELAKKTRQLHPGKRTSFEAFDRIALGLTVCFVLMKRQYSLPKIGQ